MSACSAAVGHMLFGAIKMTANEHEALKETVDHDFVGNVDQWSYHDITGWAADRAHPDEIFSVELKVNGRSSCCVPAKVYRADLEQAGFGDGIHGFSVDPRPYLTEGSNDVELFVADTDTRLGAKTFIAQIGHDLPEFSQMRTPPIEYIRYTCGHENFGEYQRSGFEMFTMLDLAARRYSGKRICEFERVLDFGCGTGRILQYVCEGPRLFGCDVSKPLVLFTRRSWPNNTVYNNDLEPPLDFRDGLFDLIYSFSVFSHLAQDLEIRWLRELLRIGAPGCLYLLTVHGDWVIEATLGAEREQAEAAGFYFKNAHTRGTSDLEFPIGYENSYHTSGYIRDIWSRLFEICSVIRGDNPSNYLWGDERFAPEGNIERFRPMGQDLVVMRKR